MDAVIQFEGTIYENGYGLIAQKVMRDKTLPKQSKLIYSYMCSFAGTNENGERTAFPSVSLQCDELGMSEDTYYKWRKYLIERGFVRITRQRAEGAKFDRNIYSILAVPQEPQKEATTPYPKNSGTDPYPKNPSTDNPSTENLGTNINNLNINSFNIKKQKETEKETNSVSHYSNENLIDKEKNKEELLKSSLRSAVPDKIFYVLDTFSESYQELYEWIGILFRAKKQVENDTEQLILLENYEEIVLAILQNAIRNIKIGTKIKKPNDYLFMTIKNEIEIYIASQTRLNTKANTSAIQDDSIDDDTNQESILEKEKAQFEAMLAKRRKNN